MVDHTLSTTASVPAQDLRATAQQLRAMFSQAAVGIAIADREGRFTEANEKACSMLGYGLDELRQVSFFEVTHPDDLQRTREESACVLAGERDSYALEKRYVRKDGGTIWSSTTVTLVRDAKGDVDYYFGILQPIDDRKAAEEMGSRLAAVVSSSDDAIITKTLSGIITTWNPAAEATFGYTAEEAVGQSVTMLIPPEHQDEEPEILLRLRRGERVQHYETVRRRKDGSLLNVSLSVSPVKDGSGRIVGASKIVRDITRQKQAEAALREHSQVLELLSAAGVSIASELDLRSVLQRVTDLGTQMSGAAFGAFFYNVSGEEGESLKLYTLSGAPRESFEKLGLPRNTPVFRDTFKGEGVVRCDDITQDPRYGRMAPHFGMPQGHLPVRSYLALPVVSRSGTVLGALLFGHPLPGVFTSRAEKLISGVAVQAAVAMDNAHLYGEAQREIASREVAEAKLREADRRKDEFLATLAHELRNPLAPIRQAAALAGTPSATAEQRRAANEIIGRQVRHMSALLDDLLDMARATTGTFELLRRPTTLGEVVAAAVETAGPAVDLRSHALRVDVPQPEARLVADPLRLAQVLANLLTNAAKYTDSGGAISLQAVIQGGQAVFTVRDNGIGLAEESLPQLFTMFTQVQSARSRSDGGLGIGLALAKALVALHGGSITAHSDGLGHGSEFTVSVPTHVEEAAGGAGTEVATAASTATAKGSRRVLIADDNQDAALTLGMLLEISGHQVSIAHDGEEALARFDAHRPELVVLDIGMPKLDGYEVARRLRARKADGAFMLVALTGWGQAADKQRARDAGFDLHFTKPVDPDRLLALLENMAPR